MRKFFKNISMAGFLLLFLPYTITLLVSGRHGIHQEKELPYLEYQVLGRLMEEDYSWMEDGTLELMAVLYRTEYARKDEPAGTREIISGIYEENYERMYKAVACTQGQVVTVDGEYRELPYHMVSAGCTRDGRLLGDEFSYINAVECPQDPKSPLYIQIINLAESELQEVLGVELDGDKLSVNRDDEDYVLEVDLDGHKWQGEDFRTRLHLPSSCFWIEALEGGARITVKGSGHGFGISLYTADCMIREGAKLLEIFQKFYGDTVCISTA